MKIRALTPVMKPNTPRRMVLLPGGGYRDESQLLPSDGAVEVDDDRYWRRRVAIGDVALVEEQKPKSEGKE